MSEEESCELGNVLAEFLGRPLRPAEIVSALGVSRSTYYLAREQGRLATAANLLVLARAFAINPVELLVRYGFVTREDAERHAGCNDGYADPDVGPPG